MFCFDKIMFKLKLEIEKIEECSNVVRDKKLAKYLEIEHNNFATMKHRETIPFLKIISFCKKNNIDLNYIFS